MTSGVVFIFYQIAGANHNLLTSEINDKSKARAATNEIRICSKLANSELPMVKVRCDAPLILTN